MILSPSIRQFVRHYIEMVIAMVAGMVALGLPAEAAMRALGTSTATLKADAPEIALLGMAVTMTVPMVAWMRYRGHGWARAWEMTASMFAPTVAAIALFRTGAVEDTHALLMIQHIAMFPAMLGVMLLRLDEYTGHAGHVLARD